MDRLSSANDLHKALQAVAAVLQHGEDDSGTEPELGDGAPETAPIVLARVAREFEEISAQLREMQVSGDLGGYRSGRV